MSIIYDDSAEDSELELGGLNGKDGAVFLTAQDGDGDEELEVVFQSVEGLMKWVDDVREKALALNKTHEVPAEPSAYHDKYGIEWLLSEHAHNTWFSVKAGWTNPESATQFAPFTRLVPMPTPEALVEAIDHAELKDGTTIAEDQADAVLVLLTGEERHND